MVLAKLGLGAAIGYGLSWLFFFVSLPIFIRIFGRINGTAIDYMVSWGLLLGIMYVVAFVDSSALLKLDSDGGPVNL